MTLAARAGAESPWTGFDTTSYRLQQRDAGYQLLRPEGLPLPIPKEWLEPPGAREEDEQSTVDSLRYVPEVTAFAIGAGRLGLHLASYDIQRQGSLQATAGRDVFLFLDAETGVLSLSGPFLGVSRGRARIGGCFQALFHHFAVGDIDCDRRLDLAVVRESITCGFEDDGPSESVYARRSMRWYRQQATGWLEDGSADGQLPCAGLAELPLLAVEMTPVDFVLGFKRRADPLLSGAPQPFESH